MRGKQRDISNHSVYCGYIPACAGETARGPCPRTRGRVHPRVCGGNSGGAAASVSVSGTSPRVRGKRFASTTGTALTRYIPACAGETVRTADLPAQSRVHPRVCGGNLPRPPINSGKRGTSPRVRGKPLLYRAFAFRTRYIPACAGETGFLNHCFDLIRVHPRVCGGNFILSVNAH